MARVGAALSITLATIVVGGLADAGGSARAASPTGESSRPAPPAIRCFATNDSRVIGVDRICYYRYGGPTLTAVTVRATDICPIFIDR